MAYRCVATTIEGFIQQLAVCYVGRGYWYYVTGRVPAGKAGWLIDQRLSAKYQLDISKWTRCRRKRAGRASMQYIRHNDFFVLLATEGAHRFFEEEGPVIKDNRKVPITYAGYSISYCGGTVHVRLAEDTYKDLRAYFLDIAVHRSVAYLAGEFYKLPFEPYGPVKVQLFGLLEEVNDARRRAGFARVPGQAVWVRPKRVKPFETLPALDVA
jgi:hypothetical protein